MPVSIMLDEDFPELVEVRTPPGMTDILGGPGGTVAVVDGVAQNGVSRRVAERLQAILGDRSLWIVGPWPPAAPDPPPPPPPVPPMGTVSSDDPEYVERVARLKARREAAR